MPPRSHRACPAGAEARLESPCHSPATNQHDPCLPRLEYRPPCHSPATNQLDPCLPRLEYTPPCPGRNTSKLSRTYHRNPSSALLLPVAAFPLRRRPATHHLLCTPAPPHPPHPTHPLTPPVARPRRGRHPGPKGIGTVPRFRCFGSLLPKPPPVSPTEAEGSRPRRFYLVIPSGAKRPRPALSEAERGPHHIPPPTHPPVNVSILSFRPKRRNPFPHKCLRLRRPSAAVILRGPKNPAVPLLSSRAERSVAEGPQHPSPRTQPSVPSRGPSPVHRLGRTAVRPAVLHPPGRSPFLVGQVSNLSAVVGANSCAPGRCRSPVCRSAAVLGRTDSQSVFPSAVPRRAGASSSAQAVCRSVGRGWHRNPRRAVPPSWWDRPALSAVEWVPNLSAATIHRACPPAVRCPPILSSRTNVRDLNTYRPAPNPERAVKQEPTPLIQKPSPGSGGPPSRPAYP